jgi:uncharacterized protein (TIGR02145 family)
MKLLKLSLFTILLLNLRCSSNSDSDSNTSDNPVTDIDGNIYQTVTICSQVWSQRNLQVARYRNGDVIPQVTDATQWTNLTTGAWCYYNNDPATEATYGKLYNWYAVNDPRGLAPSGWHIPNDDEYTTLIENCLGGFGEAGGKMKEAGTVHWGTPNTLATNSSGFTGLPAGYRTFSGSFNFIGEMGYFWIATTSDTEPEKARYLSLYKNISNANRNSIYKFYGFSVRCVKD